MRARIAFVINPRMPHHMSAYESFAEGLEQHGIACDLIEGDSATTGYDLVVFWSYRFHEAMKRQRLDGKDFLVLEQGYVGDRDKWVSVGYNGLHGFAEHAPLQRKHPDGINLLPWNLDRPDAPWIIMGQLKGDANTINVNLETWYRRVADLLKQQGQRVVYRPHPRNRGSFFTKPDGVDSVSNYPLDEDLSRARGIVAYNSNSAVDAVIAGVPTVTMNKSSMAWDVTAHEPGVLAYPDRTDWLRWICGCQWSWDEIRNGTCWENIARRAMRTSA